MKLGWYEDWSPVEEVSNQDLENMWTNYEQTERAMYPENKENLHWMELAMDDPLFVVRYTRLFGSNLYSIDITQKPPSKEGVRHMGFEAVYPLYHELNEIIEADKPTETAMVTIKVNSREHWDVTYTAEFPVDQWSYSKTDEIMEGLADQLMMKQNLNGGLLVQLTFNE